MCGFVINILKYEKEGKKRKRKKPTLATAKYKTPNCHFCLWLVDYSASILANHRPRSWKSLEILDCFEAQSKL